MAAPAAARDELASSLAVVVGGHLPAATCAAWTAGVYRAREHWTHDFGGEQFSLGRAFYTHFEEGKSRAYFDAPDASDARVEAAAPDLQATMRALVADITGARVVQRRGWCGPGIHVFPPRAPVARRGGVLHFDTEGLGARHVARRLPAITVVAVLQTAATPADNARRSKREAAGGLRVWDVRYEGRDHPTDEEIARPSACIAYGVGDVVILDSYRLHQIQPFDGDRERISATIHAAEVDRGLWETWF